MTSEIDDYLARRAKWESDQTTHDWSEPHFEQVKVDGVPQGPKLRQQYCKRCIAYWDANHSLPCPGEPAHLLAAR